jgi:hypothetical protein
MKARDRESAPQATRLASMLSLFQLYAIEMKSELVTQCSKYIKRKS